jgi:hypothetical protein
MIGVFIGLLSCPGNQARFSQRPLWRITGERCSLICRAVDLRRSDCLVDDGKAKGQNRRTPAHLKVPALRIAVARDDVGLPRILHCFMTFRIRPGRVCSGDSRRGQRRAGRGCKAFGQPDSQT